jgi:hypothetical protein
MTNRISISPAEVKNLQDWLERLDSIPHSITIIAEQTPIGLALRAEIETKEGEGKWKDLTDYNSW